MFYAWFWNNMYLSENWLLDGSGVSNVSKEIWDHFNRIYTMQEAGMIGFNYFHYLDY